MAIHFFGPFRFALKVHGPLSATIWLGVLVNGFSHVVRLELSLFRRVAEVFINVGGDYDLYAGVGIPFVISVRAALGLFERKLLRVGPGDPYWVDMQTKWVSASGKFNPVSTLVYRNEHWRVERNDAEKTCTFYRKVGLWRHLPETTRESGLKWSGRHLLVCLWSPIALGDRMRFTSLQGGAPQRSAS